MLIFVLSENSHVDEPLNAYFCRTMKTILKYVVVLMTIISCNNEDHDKKSAGPGTQQVADHEKVLQDSVLKFPDSLLLKEQLIQYYRDNDNYEKAINTTDEFLRKDSLNARLWDIKATLYFENDDTANAIRSLETAVQLIHEPGYLMKLGALYAKSKNKKALDIADILLQGDFSNVKTEAFYIKGLYHTYTGDKNKAIGFFERSLLNDYNYMPAYLEKAIAFYDQGKFNDALKVLDKAVTLQNKFDEGYYWKGRCLEKLNKKDEAVEQYQLALLYSPDYTEAKDALTRLGVK